MLNTILHTIKANIEQYALASADNEDEFVVRFVDPNSSEDTLYPDAINIALFGSIPEKEIRGSASFNVPTSGNLGIAQKAPLKLTIDLLLLFNFNKYDTAIECYEQVLGYFYNHDVLNIPFDGYETRVEVLLSGFTDRNEIEIWNSFNTPGIPMLRYFFRYVLISGKVAQLPVIQEVSATVDTMDAEAAGIDPMVLSYLYEPIVDMVQAIVQATVTFCSVDRLSDSADALLSTCFTELMDSYAETLSNVQEYKQQLKGGFKKDPTMRKEFEPFVPAISGLQLLVKKYAKKLEFLGADLTTNYAKICVMATRNIRGRNSGISGLFLQQLSTNTAYVEITTNIEAQISEFMLVGDSTYIPVGSMPYDSFKNNEQLSQLQLQKKWWDLEDLLKKTSACYADEEANSLVDQQGAVYENFCTLLKSCAAQLDSPIETFTALNQQYNNRTTEITSEIQEQYKDAYTNAYEAINYIDKQTITSSLAKSLQLILLKLST